VVLVAMGPLAAQAARDVAAELPLGTALHDPASVAGLNGGNVTGVAFSVPMRNQLAAFRAVNPKASRIGVVYSAEALTASWTKAARGLRTALGWCCGRWRRCRPCPRR
jgi:ABC-type uncharacterized transport system substrate-binding protein